MTDNEKLQFASDNYSGICPEAMEALTRANDGFARAYGDDPWTQEAADLLRDFFERSCEVFFVYSGTAANSLALATVCRSYHSVICHEISHLETDECGVPEFFTHGTKILTVPGADGKINSTAAEEVITRRNDLHYPRPKAISVTQSTELGTVYDLRELAVLKDLRGRYGLRLHMDGARLANALASGDVSPAEMTWKAGVDILCLGGTKNGMAMCEAVIFFNPDEALEFEYRCKQAGQLGSKMRFISAQWAAMLKSGAYMRNAVHANSMAELLESRLRDVPGIRIINRRQANALFVEMPPQISSALREEGWQFYNFIGTGYNRFMCSWNTSSEAVVSLASRIRVLAEAK